MKGSDTDSMMTPIKIEDIKTITEDYYTSNDKKEFEESIDSSQQFVSGPSIVSAREKLDHVDTSASASSAVKDEDGSALKEYSELKNILETNKSMMDENLRNNLTPSHANNVTVDKSKRLCHICGKVFSRDDIVRRHMVSHTGEKNFKCPTCGKNFTRADSLVRHISRLHDA